MGLFLVIQGVSALGDIVSHSLDWASYSTASMCHKRLEALCRSFSSRLSRDLGITTPAPNRVARHSHYAPTLAINTFRICLTVPRLEKAVFNTLITPLGRRFSASRPAFVAPARDCSPTEGFRPSRVSTSEDFKAELAEWEMDTETYLLLHFSNLELVST